MLANHGWLIAKVDMAGEEYFTGVYSYDEKKPVFSSIAGKVYFTDEHVDLTIKRMRKHCPKLKLKLVKIQKVQSTSCEIMTQ